MGGMQVRVRSMGNGTTEYLEEQADAPSSNTAALSSQLLDDFQTGLNSTAFYIKAVKPHKVSDGGACSTTKFVHACGGSDLEVVPDAGSLGLCTGVRCEVYH